MDDATTRRSGDAAASAAQPPTSLEAAQQSAQQGALHGRRAFEVAAPTGRHQAAETELDRARAHARASAQAQQASVRAADTDGDYRPSADTLAAVQALAAAEAAAAGRARELRPREQKPLDRFLGVHALQIVAAQIAVLAAVSVWRRDLVVLIPVVVAALAVLVLAFGRHRGKWLYQWLFLRVRFFTRRRRHRVADRTDSFTPFARGARLDRLDVDGTPIGVLRHAGGFVAVVEPTPSAGIGRAQTGGVLPPLGELLPASTDASPQIALQVLVHTIPAPGQLTADDAAAASYAELAGGAIPGQRRTLIAVQAQYGVDTFIPADRDAALVNAVRRLRRKLTKAGFVVGVLSRDELSREFSEVARGALDVSRDEEVVVREAWRQWQVGAAGHVTYRIVGWPNLADETGAQLIEYISAAPSLDTTVSIAARNVDGVVHVEAAVRLQAENGPSSDAVRAALTEVVERCGATLERLDGRHGFGMGASVPLGGFAA